MQFRPLTEGDYDWLHAWGLSEYRVGRRHGLSLSHSQFVAWTIQHVRSHWIIEIDGAIGGQALMYNMHLELGVAQIAVDLLPDFASAGHAKEALLRVRSQTFERFPLRKLYVHRLLVAAYDPLRSPWLQAPFLLEGVLPRHEIVSGRFCDLAIWGTFARD